jgi:hypothetical protein
MDLREVHAREIMALGPSSRRKTASWAKNWRSAIPRANGKMRNLGSSRTVYVLSCAGDCRGDRKCAAGTNEIRAGNRDLPPRTATSPWPPLKTATLKPAAQTAGKPPFPLPSEHLGRDRFARPRLGRRRDHREHRWRFQFRPSECVSTWSSYPEPCDPPAAAAN